MGDLPAVLRCCTGADADLTARSLAKDLTWIGEVSSGWSETPRMRNLPAQLQGLLPWGV
jgi:hypothetical protein